MTGVEWFKDSIIYHILIDRFAGIGSSENWKKPDFVGGNLKGITKNIDYLKDLGVNTIWISPFYQTSAYHGYHITDFFKVDPHFGNLKDLENLISTLHNEEMKIITDFVPNHCSKHHPFFKEAQSSKSSKYYKWFYFTNWPKDYLCFLSVRDIPKLNLDYAPARNHIIDAAKYWLSLGLDGYRLDHVIGPSHNFWKNFRKEIKTNFPEAVLIGEAWMQGIKFNELKTINLRFKFLKWLLGASSDRLLKEYIGELDGVLDFRFQELMKSFFSSDRSDIDKKLLMKTLKNHYKKFPKSYFLPSFLDNHDMDRFLYSCKHDKVKLKEATEIQFSLPQPPIIYYGTEAGFDQKKSMWNFKSHGDLQARKVMNFKYKDMELFTFYKNLISKRKLIKKLTK